MPDPSYSRRELSSTLQALHRHPLPQPAAWSDPSDRGFLTIHLIERSIAALAPRLAGELIDVGCGRQPYRAYFQHLTRTVACDHDAARGEVDFTCPAHALPVPPESFDAVLCTEVLEHVPDPLAVWQEFHRVLRPGGHVLLTTPMYWPTHEAPYDFYRYTEYGLHHLATEAGFTVEALWPRGGMWAFLGQAGMHVLGHYLPWRPLRRIWNQTFLRIDRARLNPMITLGWTILAQKPAASSASGAVAGPVR